MSDPAEWPWPALGHSPILPALVCEQRVMNGLLQAMRDADLLLWRERLRRAEARWLEWMKFEEHEETLCVGEMR